MKFKPEYEYLVDSVRELASSWHNITSISNKLNVCYDVINAISIEKKIPIKKGAQPRTLDALHRFEDLLKTGKSIKRSAIEAGVRPKLAYSHARNMDIIPQKTGEPTRLTEDQIQSRLHPKMIHEGYTYDKTLLRYTLRCRQCDQVSNREAFSLDRDCKYCGDNSKTENEIRSWVETFGYKTEKLNLKTLDGGLTDFYGGREVDIYIKELNLGIEYCGLHWHCDKNNPDTAYHWKKMKRCEALGIRLITIFETEWIKRQAQCKNFLESILSKMARKVYARSCEIKEISLQDANQFLDDYHIQGKAKSLFAIGLFYGNELIGCATGAFHPRNKIEMTLERLCFKSNHLVVGGASRLIRRIGVEAKKRGFLCLKSWSDNRWSQGDVYLKCGFKLISESRHGYYYIGANKTLLSKQSCTKKRLAERGAVGATEKIMAQSLKYKRIYDCGKKTWILDLSNIII